ncbi:MULTISPECIES: carboxymuconolactone decarboxylase family protein [unclassified Roseovarius]|uniref:carboxymuconolactone decarboxylase family protein n=1 Tax=unclassified Roseovarius TaxID=2614913 RepID=UPI00273E880C|nr:carboxymuconolactone decarboxylase family protein [Roseovarius sp. MMSF_3350]
MTQRVDYFSIAPDAVKPVLALENHVSGKSGLDPALRHLIKLRASQINGCAFCVDMHVKQARAHGLSEQWIALVATWREARVFTPRERALLALVDSVTRMQDHGVPDDVYDAARHWFPDAEMVEIVVAIGTINIWNRLAVTFRSEHPLDNAA